MTVDEVLDWLEDSTPAAAEASKVEESDPCAKTVVDSGDDGEEW